MMGMNVWLWVVLFCRSDSMACVSPEPFFGRGNLHRCLQSYELWRHPCNSIATYSLLPPQPQRKPKLCRPFLEVLLSRDFRNDVLVGLKCSRTSLEAAGELEGSFSITSASLRSTNHRRVRYECENHQAVVLDEGCSGYQARIGTSSFVPSVRIWSVWILL